MGVGSQKGRPVNDEVRTGLSVGTFPASIQKARSGRFSSDRSIDEYGRHIWKVEPVPVEERADQGPQP